MITEIMKRPLLTLGFVLLVLTSCQYVSIISPIVEATRTVDTYPTPTRNFTKTPTHTITATPIPIATQTPLALYLQSGSPAYIQNFAHKEEGCNWLGIAGQVFNADGKTINNLVVNIDGDLGQTKIDALGLTGIPVADIYGPGGYEIIISDKAFDSENSLTIQIFDVQGNVLIREIPIKTYSDCKKNLIIMNFVVK